MEEWEGEEEMGGSGSAVAPTLQGPGGEDNI